MKSPRSLLLITVDCFRADHAGFLGYPRPTTPFLDFAGQGEPGVFQRDRGRRSDLFFISCRDGFALSARPGAGRGWPGARRGHDCFRVEARRAMPRRPFWRPIPIFRRASDTTWASTSSRIFWTPRVSRFRWNLTGQKRSGFRAAEINVWQRLPMRSGRWARSMTNFTFSTASDWVHRRLSLDQLRRFPAADVMVDHARDWLTDRRRSAIFPVAASHGSAFARITRSRKRSH